MRCKDAKQHTKKVELSRRRAERAELKLKRIERVSGEDWKSKQCQRAADE